VGGDVLAESAAGLVQAGLGRAGQSGDLVDRQVVVAADNPAARAQELQCERCPLFVVLSRARDHLYISHSGSPSTFLG
jgi:hypothetical protein